MGGFFGFIGGEDLGGKHQRWELGRQCDCWGDTLIPLLRGLLMVVFVILQGGCFWFQVSCSFVFLGSRVLFLRLFYVPWRWMCKDLRLLRSGLSLAGQRWGEGKKILDSSRCLSCLL